ARTTMRILGTIVVCLGIAVGAHLANAAALKLAPHARPDAPVLRLAPAEPAPATAAPLRTGITALQRGPPDAASMEPPLSASLQAQGGAALLARFGALQRIECVATQGGADVYRVTFDNAVTQWTIRLSPSGRIAGLFFKPIEGPEKAGEDVTVAGLSGTLL